MPFIGIIPIRVILRMFFFSKDFGDKMVYPLIALFLGTGNQTANVSCAILERLFHDPNMKLWDYDPQTLLPNLPTMVTFPNLHNFYEDWRHDLESKGVSIRLKTDVTEVVQRNGSGVVLRTRPFDCQKKDRWGEHTGPEAQTEVFDDLVMCVLADDALKLLGKTATYKEKFVLGGARFFNDITITHSDNDYFTKHYETKFAADLCGKPQNKSQEDQIAFSKGEQRGVDNEPAGYRPMYYTKSYAEDPKKIEMSFDVTNYQHQFRQDHDAETAPVDHERHVFQSIFLDEENKQLWTMDEIDESKVIESTSFPLVFLRPKLPKARESGANPEAGKWWHQLGHRWQHYARVVPGMMFINGKNRTMFAGSWTLVVRLALAPP